jgi:hypothetical protein
VQIFIFLHSILTVKIDVVQYFFNDVILYTFQDINERDIIDTIPATAPEEHMSSNLTMKELEIAIHSLKQRNMLRRLGPVTKAVLLKLMNSSWRREIVPQVWKEAKMVPIPKPGKDKLHPNSYRPISLLSCVCKVMERTINSRLMWHLEAEKRLLLPQQAG